MASHEATDAFHRAMRIALYRPGGMVIKIIINLATLFYIVDYKIINYSFMFTIYLNHFDLALVQHLVRIALALDLA